jgi:hypothetical protein
MRKAKTSKTRRCTTSSNRTFSIPPAEGCERAKTHVAFRASRRLLTRAKHVLPASFYGNGGTKFQNKALCRHWNMARSPPRNCSHEALPFVEPAAKAKLAGGISIEYCDVPPVARRNSKLLQAASVNVAREGNTALPSLFYGNGGTKFQNKASG